MIGETISHYKILEKLGEGGMGVVYKAEDTKLERMVALKFLSPSGLGTEEEKLRFVREAKAAAMLNHPSICTVYEVDEAGDQTFICMSYLDGESLSRKLESGRLEVEEAVNIALRVAEGLKHAHKRGIIHRDIKPANIMITEDGQVKIMDFGLAKLAGKSKLTKTATVLGTAAYMSPEQANGESDIDHRTDIWALGVVLYEMLAGKPPFDASSDAAVIHKIIYEEPERISRLRSETPAALEQIIEKALQKRPQNRCREMEEMIKDLEAVKSGKSDSAASGSPSIAVLPFVNMSADPEQEYFCDGLSEELINGLTQIQDLKVIARTSAFSFKGQNLDVRAIGKKLDVQAVLEGSVRKAGNRLRITAQLIDTARGHHLWSERYDRKLDDIFAIQDEITQAIIAKLKPRLLGEEQVRLAKQRQVDMEVYNLYLRGRYSWNRRSEDGIRRAIEYFTEAIEKAPQYAPAYAGLADCHIVSAGMGFLLPKEVWPKAKAAALKALELDESSAEAHTSLATINTFFEWNWENAGKEFRRAIALNPGYATARSFYAFYLITLNRPDEGMMEIERALELDPFSRAINAMYGGLLISLREYDRAIESLGRAIELDPDSALAYRFLSVAYLGKGMYDEALKVFQKVETFPEGKSEGMAGIAWICAATGRADEAKRILVELLELRKKQYVRACLLALTYLLLGEIDSYFEWLDNAVEDRDVFPFFIYRDPVFEASDLRSDPRYLALLKKMNLDK